MVRWSLLLPFFSHILIVECGERLTHLNLKSSERGEVAESSIFQRASNPVPVNEGHQRIPLQGDSEVLGHKFPAVGSSLNQRPEVSIRIDPKEISGDQWRPKQTYSHSNLNRSPHKSAVGWNPLDIENLGHSRAYSSQARNQISQFDSRPIMNRGNQPSIPSDALMHGEAVPVYRSSRTPQGFVVIVPLDPASEAQLENNLHAEAKTNWQSVNEIAATFRRGLHIFAADVLRTFGRTPPPPALVCFGLILLLDRLGTKEKIGLEKEANIRNGVGNNGSLSEIATSDLSSDSFNDTALPFFVSAMFLTWLYFFLKDFIRYRRQ
ncbi:hypothetical protein PGT21_026477 [Puccinia graminis f. sp. tritici]|uniref:Uncharacterized protein n=1 Tax=Puccinia graminis f. sp. tritici TaxID=56615 RepID=A0A5B0SF92_PUCGR|nr:hypothetical protein PGT21_026477 [Puccinia graminis f. sp. tritici]KAA1135154.1 hypothetical protein PGTUg99_001515 [Puccinia graminis f. sp. tritici]